MLRILLKAYYFFGPKKNQCFTAKKKIKVESKNGSIKKKMSQGVISLKLSLWHLRWCQYLLVESSKGFDMSVKDVDVDQDQWDKGSS